ncbi:MAG: Nif11-like leader peptide family natural product precursor [Chlorobiaceae bacterium]|nr:Nif11-like leader peptide family natural product precursor [Chlorobiaceae bacterium]
MSVEHAKAFIEKMTMDEAFREKIMAIETPEDRLKAICAAGFECSAEEVNDAAEDAGNVAGGGRAEWHRRRRRCGVDGLTTPP